MNRIAIICALVLASFGSCGVDAAQIDPVYNVEVNGQDYALVELLHSKRDKINPLNIFRLKRGAKYWEFRVLDNEYPVRFYEHDYNGIKKDIKGIPDNRTWQDKHPNVQPTIELIDTGLTVLNWFI